MNAKNTLLITGGIIVIIAGYLSFSGGGGSPSSSSTISVAQSALPSTPASSSPSRDIAQAPPVNTPSSQTTGTTKTPSSKYKNGTFTATGNYRTPEGPESIGVSLTLKDGVVVDSSLTQEGIREESIQYQKIFASNYKQYVVGKNIDELNLSKVSRSSLTPKGFNDALAQIKAEAKA